MNETGPDHEKVFEVRVNIEGKASGSGTGNSKREASMVAAKAILKQISHNIHNQGRDS